MDTDGMGSGDDSSMPLNASGVDFSNATQAFNFLQDILDDTTLQIDGNHAATHFWYGVVVAVGLTAVCNFVSAVGRRQRLRASRANHPAPCRPSNPLAQAVATTTAIVREATYLQLTPTAGGWGRYAPWWYKVPPFGSLFVILAYLTFILVLQFIPAGDGAVSGAQHDQALSVRAAWLAVAQMPLVVLLAGKNNLVGLVAGMGPGAYARLNVLHRWTARGMLLLATFHFGIESVGWNRYDGLMELEWQTDTCPPTGIAAYALLLWMNLTTLAPLRHLSYELFVIQHLVTFFGFVIALMMHLPTTALYSRVYVYIPIGLYVLDRGIRGLRFAVHNGAFQTKRSGRATLEALEDGPGSGATRIRVAATHRHLTSWAPGSHVLLGLPRYGLAQSHPATILSTPTSHGGDLVFLLRAHGGFTRKVFEGAKTARNADLVAFVDGPYGASQADFAAFDTALLVAGGTGITFALAILLSLAERASVAAAADKRLPLRVVRVLWAVKNRRTLAWVDAELRSATDTLRAAGIEVQVTVFVTCDSVLTEEATAVPSHKTGCCCAADGPSTKECCCETGVISGSEKGSADVESVKLQAGRPEFKALFSEVLHAADGETAIGACGPLSLTTSVRSIVVQISDERAVHKGTGAQGIYLHVEAFH